MRYVNPLEEVAIRYRKVKINNNTYVLIPSGVLQGYSFDEEFLSKVKYKLATNKESLLKEKYLIDGVMSLDDLQIKYSYYDTDEIDFLCDYYFNEESNNIIIVQVDGDKIRKRKVSIPEIDKFVGNEVYERQKGIPSVVLNEESLSQLLEMEDISAIKARLQALKRSIEAYLEIEKSDYVTRIEVEDGKIVNIDTDAVVVDNPKPRITTKKAVPLKKDKPIKSDFSVVGLEKYIKERVFGHEEGIATIAKTLYMNYTAEDDDDIESILLVGPTGTGKTETIRVASEYLSVPFREINSPNLVPQGIVGTSLEDILYSLILQANYDIEVALKSLILADEIDKLGDAKSDFKGDIPQILLKLFDGYEFQFTKEHREFSLDTSKMSKICSGAFTRIFEPEVTVGFNKQTRQYNHDMAEDEVKDRITEKEYFGIEILDRIDLTVLYHELDQETKKRILLESKISKYLKKKRRYARQFNVELVAEDSYIEELFAILRDKRESVRILNNLVKKTLNIAEYELCTNPNTRGKRLILTKDTVHNPENYTII